MRRYSIFEIGNSHQYFDEQKNREVMEKVARKCYLPTNRVILDLLREHQGFKVAYSITGPAIQQFRKYAPEVLESFKELAATGRVEFLAETYYHSLAFLYNKEEFKQQVVKHRQMIKELFGQEPTVFRNTELIFNNELANMVQGMGYKAILAEGADHVLQWRSPNYTYTATTADKITLLLKNYKLSDDVAFRFSNKGWVEFPLTTEKYAAWIGAADGETINLFMDYETFGEHQWEDTGIFDFIRYLPENLQRRNIGFKLPSEIAKNKPVGELDIHAPMSWADVERDLSAWLGNKMQRSAAEYLYRLRDDVLKTGDPELIEDWKKLTTSDHYYYMCTKWFNDGDVHKYFNPFDSPYDAFISFMNIMNDMVLRIKEHTGKQPDVPVIMRGEQDAKEIC